MKIKLPILFVLIIFLAFTSEVQAQSFLSFSTGISKDLNNENHNFYYIPVTIQWKPFPRKRSPLFFDLDYNIPFIVKSTGHAYTLNPSLSQEVTLRETIRASMFTVSMGFRIHIFTDKQNNSFYLKLIPFGLSFQNFKVKYKNFDKENYEILNADDNLNSGGLTASMEAEYNFHKTKQDMVLRLHIQTPPLNSTGDYPLSYRFIAPLQLTFGYNLFYNKRK